MKKHELVEALAAQAGTSKAACERVLDALGAVTANALVLGKQVRIPGLGTFGLKQLAGRTMRTPQGNTVTVAARPAVKFSAAKAIKTALATDEAPA